MSEIVGGRACTKCGTELKKGAKFCHKCGKAAEEYYFERDGKRYKPVLPIETHTYILDENTIIATARGWRARGHGGVERGSFKGPLENNRYVAARIDVMNTRDPLIKKMGPPCVVGIETYELIINGSIQEVTPRPDEFKGVICVSGDAKVMDLVLKRMQEKPIELTRAQKKVLRWRVVCGVVPLFWLAPSVESFFAGLEPLPAAEQGYRIEAIYYNRKDKPFGREPLMEYGRARDDGVILSGEGTLSVHAMDTYFRKYFDGIFAPRESIGPSTVSIRYQIDDGQTIPIPVHPTSRPPLQYGITRLNTTKLSDGEHKLTVLAVDDRNRHAGKSVKVIVKNRL